MIFVFQILYLLVFLIFVVMALSVAYHLVKYSYDKKASVAMLLIFVSVTAILLFSNLAIFASIPFEEMLPGSF